MREPLVTWINHASFVVEYGDVRLACDPWLSGTAFKDGWALIAQTKFQPSDFHGITHIWISHQHPDHFAPADLRAIDAHDRKRITVLYQSTEDKLVVSWLRGAGFGKVVELPLKRWTELAPGFAVLCGSVSHDSWLAMRCGDSVLLNVNDCVLKRQEIVQRIADTVGRVDVLFTQFSYAQWIGNPPDWQKRRQDALEKLERLRLQAQILRPKTIVPFASFVYFCHEENFFMNDGMNAVGDVAAFIERDLGVRATVLYPGERWAAGAPQDWRPSAARYADDLRAKIAAGPTHRATPGNAQAVMDLVNAFMKRLVAKNPRVRALLRDRVTVFLSDLGSAYEISLDGMRPTALSALEADLVTSSENITYAFKVPWGGNTLHVSGRFTSWKDGAHLRVFKLIRELHHYNVTRVNVRWLRSQVRRLCVGGLNRALRLLHPKKGRLRTADAPP